MFVQLYFHFILYYFVLFYFIYDFFCVFFYPVVFRSCTCVTSEVSNLFGAWYKLGKWIYRVKQSAGEVGKIKQKRNKTKKKKSKTNGYLTESSRGGVGIKRRMWWHSRKSGNEMEGKIEKTKQGEWLTEDKLQDVEQKMQKKKQTTFSTYAFQWVFRRKQRDDAELRAGCVEDWGGWSSSSLRITRTRPLLPRPQAAARGVRSVGAHPAPFYI